MAFHFKDRWFFERLDTEGTVRIYHETGGLQRDDPIGRDVQFDIDPASWASIVASVSLSGDNAVTFPLAEKLHQT